MRNFRNHSKAALSLLVVIMSSTPVLAGGVQQGQSSQNNNNITLTPQQWLEYNNYVKTQTQQGQSQNSQNHLSNGGNGNGHGNFSPNSKSQSGSNSTSGVGPINAGSQINSHDASVTHQQLDSNNTNNTNATSHGGQGGNGYGGQGGTGGNSKNQNNNENHNGNNIGVDASSGGNTIQNGNQVDVKNGNQIGVTNEGVNNSSQTQNNIDASDRSTTNYDARSDGRNFSTNTSTSGKAGYSGLIVYDECGNPLFESSIPLKRSGFGIGGSMFGGVGLNLGINSEGYGKDGKGILRQHQLQLNMSATDRAQFNRSPLLARIYLTASLKEVFDQLNYKDSLAKAEATAFEMVPTDSIDTWAKMTKDLREAKRCNGRIVERSEDYTPPVQVHNPPVVNVPTTPVVNPPIRQKPPTQPEVRVGKPKAVDKF